MRNNARGLHVNLKKPALVLLGIGSFGVGCLIYAILKGIIAGVDSQHLVNSIVVAVLLALIFPKSVKLPSGSVWRPAIGLITYIAFIQPLYYSVLVIFSGMLLSKGKTKTNWRDLFISLGHLSMGVLSIKVVMSPFKTVEYVLPDAFYWVLGGLMTHFLVNRFVSAIIVSSRKRTGLIKQLKLIRNDLNWGYLSTYLITISMVFMFHAYGLWGMLAIVLLLYSVYYSVFYFKKANDLEKIYLTDALTGAENRAAWEIFKVKFPTNGNPGTLALVDMDHFKGINDKWGHEMGDKILCEAVKCLNGISPNTSKVFRFGGDEFLIFIPHEKDEKEQVQLVLAQTINQKNKEWLERNLKVGMSLGMEFIASNSKNLDEIFIKIDQEMYKNKVKLQSVGVFFIPH